MAKELQIQLPLLGGYVSIDKLDFINYSMQTNGIKCLRQFVLHNTSSEDWQQVFIKIGGPLIAESGAYIEELPSGAKVSLPELKIEVIGNTLADLSEGLRSHYTIEYSLRGEIVERREHEIELMAFDQWTGSSFHPELLATFVTPNHPVISSILVEVSRILEQQTGLGQIIGYQADSLQAVWQQVEALYQALRKMGLIYAVAPASFAPIGQRIRPVDQVLSEKLANCMDLSLLMASCLEAMGLNPIFVLQKGHIFPGVYMFDKYYENTTCDDLSYLQKGLQNGVHDLIVFEATSLTSPDTPSFDNAADIAEGLLKEADNFEYAIDIHACRLNGIRPMPRRLVENGEIRLVNDGLSYRHERSREREFKLLDHNDQEFVDQIKNPKQLLWERKLLDLSLNNPLLNTKLGSSALQLMCEDIEDLLQAISKGERFSIESSVRPEHSDGLNTAYSVFDIEYKLNQLNDSAQLDRIIHDELITSLKRHRLHSYARDNEHYSILKDLHRHARLSQEENGANSLYLALGFIRWSEVEGGRSYATPLVLVPVELKRKNLQSYTLEIQDAEATFNITLIEYIYQKTNYRMTGLHPLPLNEAGGIDLNLILARMRSYLRELKGWEVVSEAVLGNYSFTKFVMWNDIHHHSETLNQHPIVSTLMGVNEGKDLDESLIPSTFTAQELEQCEDKEVLLPIDADSSQIEAILEAMRGKSFVLHGPPGTGKSQTITNIIANMLNQGKRVLFVAEKMAALEVVRNRMEKIGLGAFCLELHGNKVTKKHFLSQMDRALSAEATQANKRYTASQTGAVEEQQKILATTEALHQPRPEGYSLHDLICHYESIHEQNLDFTPSAKLCTAENIERLKRELSQLESIFRISGHPREHNLRELILQDATKPCDTSQLQQSLSTLEQSLSERTQWQARLQNIIGISPTDEAESYQHLGKIVSCLLGMPRFCRSWLEQAESLEGLDRAIEVCQFIDEALTTQEKLQSLYGCIPSLESQTLAQRYHEVEVKWFIPKYFARQKLIKDLEHIGVRVIYEQIPQVIEHLQAYELCHQKLNPSDHKLLSSLANYEGLGSHQLWSELSRELGLCSQLAYELSALTAIHQESYTTLRQSLLSYTGECWHLSLNTQRWQLQDFINFVQEMTKHLHLVGEIIQLPQSINLDKLQQLLKQWQMHLPQLRDWTQWLLRRAELINIGAESIIEYIEHDAKPMEQLSLQCERSIYQHIAEQIIAQDQRLSMFNGLIFEETLKLYRNFIAESQELSRKELYRRMVQRIPGSVGTASPEIAQEIAELKRFIASGGRRRSIRSMMDAIPNLLPRLAPCMLMSPLSVAQYIEMTAPKFDLVIFDEASQMPTSDAVGTIARGKALIVVGDPKQMPPTSFFVNQQLAEEDQAIDDMESILDECITLSIPSRYLAWHYRSRHESLIAFSNNRFYDGKLYTFPSVDNQVSKLSLVKVNGIYARSGSRNNPIEADAIVAELIRRLQSTTYQGQSIGIVAFSQAQQELIEDKLYSYTHKHPEIEKLLSELPEPLFIKNLENVQGDERDVILFSVGYGPDQEGKISMNFGPLNNKGGERRLNVAASRSRLEMMIFTSISPEQIDLKRTESEGVASLKLLLECAEIGSERLAARLGQLRKPSPLVSSLAKEIESQGYELDLMVGTSSFRVDIAVRDPKTTNQYLAGIICDGEGYYKTRTVRDREYVQSLVLKRLGWKVIRLWSLDWHNNKERTLNQILDALKNA